MNIRDTFRKFRDKRRQEPRPAPVSSGPAPWRPPTMRVALTPAQHATIKRQHRARVSAAAAKQSRKRNRGAYSGR